MFFVVIAIFTLYPQYTSVYLCIRVNIMNFIEQQQMTVSVSCICIFVQYDFVYQVASFSLLNIIFNIFAGAFGQTSHISLWVNAVCTEENIFKTCFIPIFDNLLFFFYLSWNAI